MAALMAGSRLLFGRLKVGEVLRLSSRAATALRWTSLLSRNADTVERGRALAYRWSALIPGCSCLHRASTTQVWLGAFRIDARVILGVRRRGEQLEGHAWLEVYANHDATLLFIEDEGYPTELPLS